jgi:23S rRNA pseudouridine2605 synthase
MSENDNWREMNSQEENSGNRFERENGYNRSSYNQDGDERPQRPRFTNNNDGNTYERPQRPRFNNGEGGYDRPQQPRQPYGERPYRPRFNNGGGYDRPQQPRQPYGERPQRPRFNNNEGGGYDRPQRPRFNNNDGGGYDRPQRPRFNNNDGGGYERHQSYGQQRSPYGQPRSPYGQQRSPYGQQRSPYGQQRPYYNNGGGRPGGFNRPQQRRTGDYDPNAKYSKKKQIEYKEMFIDPNEPIRLNKFLANAGVCSRREADEFITAGVVKVNGEVVTELGTKIKRGDEVMFHEQPVSIERKIYILLNKPKDCVTTSDDPQARRTVMDLLKGACPERIYPVGRLDRNTTGVLLLTNDGDLASKLTHPQYLKKKVYQVTLDKNLTQADMNQIAEGIKLDEETEVHADAIEYADEVKHNVIGIEIHSGQNRIVRRIFESLGYKVNKLDRVLFAGLTKKGLKRGEWRFLNQQEVNFLSMGSFA